MTPDNENYVTDLNQLLSRVREDLRLCREALLEAKQRIITLEQRLRIFLTCLIILLGGTLCYGTVQVWQTSTFLQDLGRYVRQERDPRWEKMMNEIHHTQEVIKNHLDKIYIE